MILEKKNIILIVGFFILTLIACLVGVSTNNTQVVNVAIPLFFVSLITMYIGLVKKVDIYFLLYLILLLISETLFLYKKEYFNYIILSSTISQIILIYFIISFKHISYKTAIPYSLVTFLGYFVIYIYVLDVDVNSSSIVLLYGIVNAVLVGFTMANHLRKMYLANYLLFLGVAFGVLNNAIMSLDIKGVNSNILALVTNIITHASICLSFITRVNRPAKKFRDKL